MSSPQRDEYDTLGNLWPSWISDLCNSNEPELVKILGVPFYLRLLKSTMTLFVFPDIQLHSSSVSWPASNLNAVASLFLTSPFHYDITVLLRCLAWLIGLMRRWPNLNWILSREVIESNERSIRNSGVVSTCQSCSLIHRLESIQHGH